MLNQVQQAYEAHIQAQLEYQHAMVNYFAKDEQILNNNNPAYDHITFRELKRALQRLRAKGAQKTQTRNKFHEISKSYINSQFGVN